MPEIVFSSYHVQDGDRNWWDEFHEGCEEGYLEGWTCKKTASSGDLYVFFFGNPRCCIAGVGVAVGNQDEYDEEGDYEWTGSAKWWFCDFDPLRRLDQPIPSTRIASDPVLSQWWVGGRVCRGRPKRIRDRYAIPLLQLIVETNPALADIINPYVEDLEGRGRPLSNPDARGPRPVVDSDEPPPTVEATIRRVIRDTPRARTLKELYDHRCQICGDVIRVPGRNGGYYCEVHHLRPLGGNHHGIDAWKNMIVVCPTCHAEFDLLSAAIEPREMRIATYAKRHPHRGKRLRLKRGHALDDANLRYGWRLFRKACRS